MNLKPIKTKNKKKKTPKPLVGGKLTTALDNVIREILHTLYPEGRCFVSGNTYGWFHPKKNPHGCQVGHYISRRVFPLRWDLKNVYPQGSGENRIHQTNILPFTKAILDVYGKERIDYLDGVFKKYKQSGSKMTTKEKRELLETLTNYLQEITNGSLQQTNSLL